MSTLARRTLREAAKTALSAIAGVTLESPGDWETPPVKLPNVKLRASSERKTSTARAMPTFTTVVTLDVLYTVSASTDSAAQDALESLGASIEDALFGNVALVGLIQQFATVSTQTIISAEGQIHIARTQMSVDCECFESFDPTVIDPTAYPNLTQVHVDVDTASPFDAAGTYINPPFPASVTPAPRTTGPDGRDEGTLQIDLT